MTRLEQVSSLQSHGATQEGAANLGGPVNRGALLLKEAELPVLQVEVAESVMLSVCVVVVVLRL